MRAVGKPVVEQYLPDVMGDQKQFGTQTWQPGSGRWEHNLLLVGRRAIRLRHCQQSSIDFGRDGRWNLQPIDWRAADGHRQRHANGQLDQQLSARDGTGNPIAWTRRRWRIIAARGLPYDLE